MQPTRRFWGAAAVGVLLAIAGIVYDHLGLLVGAAGIGAWLLATTYAFLRAATRAADGLEVTQSLSASHAAVEDPVVLTLGLTATPEGVTTRADARLPPGLERVDGDSTVTAGDARPTALSVQAAVAGTHTVPPPRITIADDAGLFTETLLRGPAAELTAEPRRPRNVHVGTGGDRLPTAFGEHSLGRRGSGLEPLELREYVTGDAADRIDWNATARLDSPYVREYVAESDLRTLFVVDCRAAMAAGPGGETKLDYARAVALAFVNVSQNLDDPVGLVAIDDDGVATIQQPTSSVGGYRSLRRRIHGLEASDRRASRRRIGVGTPLSRRATELGGDAPFDVILRGYVGDKTPLPTEASPLRAAVRAGGGDEQATARTILLTDDSDRRGVREAIEEARRGGGRVVVFLTPTALFDPGALGDLSAAYERYREFEDYRRDLDSLGGCEAYEVAPGDRIDAVLEASASVSDDSATGRATEPTSAPTDSG